MKGVDVIEVVVRKGKGPANTRFGIDDSSVSIFPSLSASYFHNTNAGIIQIETREKKEKKKRTPYVREIEYTYAIK